MFSRTIHKNLITVLGAALLINGFVVLSYYLSVAPIGTDFFLFISTFAVLPLLAAFLIAPISLVFLFSRRFRVSALAVFIGCVIYLVVGFAGIKLANEVRRSGFVSLAHRSRPLISAIEQFETKYEILPEKLEQLVPEFLSAIPNTGIGAYPNYEYITVKDAKTYEGNPWVLRVATSTGALNWDSFLYFPKQNYPQVGYGGVLERIEDWAYVYE